MYRQRERLLDTVDIVMLGTFSAWRLGTLQARALPLAVALRDFGLRCAIVTVPWDQRDERGVVEYISGIPLLNTMTTAVPAALRSVAEQLALIRTLNPRFVHVFKPKGSGGLSGAISRTRPMIVDCDDWEGDGGWNRLGSYNALQRRVFDWQERRMIRDADRVTAASMLLVRRARDLRPRHEPGATHYLPNGLATSWFEQLRDAPKCRTPQPEMAAPQIVMYSRFAEFPSGWMRSFLAELDRIVASPVTLRVIGESAPIDSGMGMENVAIDLMGYVARDKIPSAFAHAQIAVYPYSDSLVSRSKNSVKLLELMASGCAVIAADIGDVSPTIGHAGLLVRAGDPVIMARAANLLLMNPSLREKLAIEAQHRVATLFTVDAVAAELRDVYARCTVTDR